MRDLISRVGKKATEKPIEIFIALFIILAVAMVMLKMFKGQISEKTTEMKEIERTSALEQALTDARLECKTLCTRAAQEDCSLRAMANFCIKKMKGLDIDGDRATTGYDSTLLGGIGLCEDNIYCPHLTECNCGEELTISNCIKLMCNYWASQGINTVSDRTSLLNNSYKVGGCTIPAGSRTWLNLTTGFTCS